MMSSRQVPSKRSKQEQAVVQLFEQPFASAQDVRYNHGVHDFLIADVVEQAHAGLRLQYTLQTADWLTHVRHEDEHVACSVSGSDWTYSMARGSLLLLPCRSSRPTTSLQQL